MPVRWFDLVSRIVGGKNVVRAQRALEGAISTLPHPVSSNHIQSIAETFLRSASEGERDPIALRTMMPRVLQFAVTMIAFPLQPRSAPARFISSHISFLEIVQAKRMVAREARGPYS
jgi:hypothetical protein